MGLSWLSLGAAMLSPLEFYELYFPQSRWLRLCCEVLKFPRSYLWSNMMPTKAPSVYRFLDWSGDYSHRPVAMYLWAWVFWRIIAAACELNSFEITLPMLFLANQSLEYYRFEGSEWIVLRNRSTTAYNESCESNIASLWKMFGSYIFCNQRLWGEYPALHVTIISIWYCYYHQCQGCTLPWHYLQRDTTTQRLHMLPPTTPHNTKCGSLGERLGEMGLSAPLLTKSLWCSDRLKANFNKNR